MVGVIDKNKVFRVTAPPLLATAALMPMIGFICGYILSTLLKMNASYVLFSATLLKKSNTKHDIFRNSAFLKYLLYPQLQTDYCYGDGLSEHPAVYHNLKGGIPCRGNWSAVPLSHRVHCVPGSGGSFLGSPVQMPPDAETI